MDVTNVHHGRLVTLEDNLETLLGMVQAMKAKVGSAVDIGDRFTAPTLWGSTAFIAEDLSRVTEVLYTLQAEVVIPMKESLAVLESAEKTKPGLWKDVDKLIRAVKHLVARVQNLGGDMGEMRRYVGLCQTDIVYIRAEQGIKFSNTERTESEDATDDLMEYIMSDEERVEKGASKSEGTAEDPIAVSPEKVNPDVEGGGAGPSEHIQSILSKRIDDVKCLQTAKHTTSIRFANLGMRDLSDCGAWIAKNFKHYKYGLIMDPLLMLDQIHGDDEVGDSSGLMKTMELRYKLNIDSGGESAALNALRHCRPRVFHIGRPSIVTMNTKSRLTVLPSHDKWNGSGDGIMDMVLDKMIRLQNAVSSDIDEALPIESQGHWIASKCLSASVTFFTQLFTCVDTIYKKLFNFSKVTTEQAWSLTTQVLDRILADLFVPKDNILNSIKNRSPESTCGHVLYAAFKTHDIMANYMSHKFENHPSVSTEYVKFLATNSGSEKVGKLTVSVESALSKAEAATKKADIAASKNADLTRALEVLTKRVHRLENP